VLVERTVGARVGTVSELVSALSLDPDAELRGRCPPHAAPQCWHEPGEVFEADDATLRRVAKDLDKLESGGGEDHRGALGDRVHQAPERRGRPRKVPATRSICTRWSGSCSSCASGATVTFLAILGKVGGYTQYEAAFGPAVGPPLCGRRRAARAEHLSVSRGR
jgi:hypothetical protein